MQAGSWIVRLTGAALFAALCIAPVEAATQGEMGESSTAQINISLSVAPRVRIGGLGDVAFISVSPDSAATSAQNVCVWSNTATRGYRLTASGSGAGEGFALASAAGSTPYAAYWSDRAGQGSGTALSPGMPLSGLTSAATSPDCSSGDDASASLIVEVAADDLSAAQPGANYTGALNLLISPE